MADEGLIQVQSGIIPTNENPRQWVTRNRHVKGSPQTFLTIQDLVNFHPALMESGMIVTVINYPAAGVISEYRLNTDPGLLVDASNASIITLDNFLQFWDPSGETQSSKTRVYQYSADGPGGGAPVYPYTPETESNWVNTFDATKGHRWLRWRDDDVDANSDGIYDNWTVPILVNSAYTSGDYIENRFRRQAVSNAQHSGVGTLQVDKYYIIDVGRVQIQGDLSLNDIGVFGTVTDITLGTGRRFKYASANTYTFLSSAIVIETLAPPPRTVGGLPNNEPAGWTDTIPGGTDQLWQITAQKSIYGQLKSEWLIKKVIENPSYVRYSNTPTPHPDTLVGPNTPATTGSPGDIALNNAGWSAIYDNHSFIATREDDPGPNLFTTWLVEKINEESGEYTDRVFKLFDVNLDADSPALAPPTQRDPTSEGWSDTPVVESDTQINYVSEARKFFNGELKTPWSNPVPYTGKDTFNDVIDTDLGNDFHYDQNGAVLPTQITLTAKLFKGLSKLWINGALGITYTWKKVYDNGSVVNVDPTSNPADDFYLLGSSGTPGDDNYLRTNQRVVIKPAAVNGTAVFRCTQTLAMVDGDDIVFEEEFSILDITDGKDAKSLVVSADNDRIVYDSVNLVFNPAAIILRGYTANIPSPTLYWYRWNGSAWVAITTGGGYTIAGNTLTITPATLFAADDTAQEQRFALSTHATNPDLANYDTTFSDFITVVKLGSAAVGTPGVDALSALLSNESHVIVLDFATGVPIAGEIGSGGRAKTTIQVYEGLTKLIYGGGGDYTLGLASDNAGVTFAQVANGSDGDIYVNTWNANEKSAVCTITITRGSDVFTKKFSLASTKDAPGAILLDVDSDKGFVFTPGDKTNKTFTARLYNTSLTGNQQVALPDAMYTFRWKVANVFGTNDVNNFTRTVTRADILTTEEVMVEVYKSGVLHRTRTIKVSDVNDGRSSRAWTNSASVASNQKLTNQDPTTIGAGGVNVNGVVWRLPTDSFWATNQPKFAQDAEYNNVSGAWTWNPPYQIQGEQGSQGVNGNFFFDMYKTEDPGPPSLGAGGNTSSLGQMQAAAWQARPAASGIIWKTSRLWTGQGVTFDGAGYPSTGPVSGSAWTAPIKLSAKNGINGNNGSDGSTGWSPVFAIVTGAAAGTKVMQLVDWTGGTGAKPGFINQYLSLSGFTADINAAQTITGVPVEFQWLAVSGTHVQWKYTNEDAGAWRDLFPYALPRFYDTFIDPTEQTISNSQGEVQIISNMIIPARNFRRMLKIRGEVRVRSDSNNNDDYFRMWIRASINGVGAGIISPVFGETRPTVNDAGQGFNMVVFANLIVQAGEEADLSLSLYLYLGGSGRYAYPYMDITEFIF